MPIRQEAACLLLVLICSSIRAAHEPEPGQPSFLRTAVESPPEYPKELEQFSLKPSFGDTFLPLRSAVESAPISTIPSSKSFIRESVESRPITDYEETELEDEESNELRSDTSDAYKTPDHDAEYAAYNSPDSYDKYNPQPFRFGSPYQEIVQYDGLEELSQESLKNYDSDYDENDLRKQKTDEYKVLCYVTNWSFYRKGEGKFVPENIDKELCTHIIYAFASLNPETLMMKEFDPWADIDNELYQRTTSLGVPVLLAIGGWTDSTGDKYSKLVSDPLARRAFIGAAIPFLQRYGFAGIHFDWNYPKCWQSNCKKGPSSDKPNFTKFIEELSSELQKRSMQLGVAISGYKEIITDAYDLPRLSKAADMLTVMTYDYHGAWEDQTGHVSPLYGRLNDKYPQYNTDFAIQLLLKSGATREKLILGVPFYGQSFQLQQSHIGLVGEGTAARGPGNAGEFTRQPGMLAYYEICGLIRKQKWQTAKDNNGKSGPYATYRDQWVGYDDPSSLDTKAKYVIRSGLGGISAWTIDLDDFLNRCCLESYPLLRSINRAFGRLRTSPPSPGNCAKPSEPVTPVAPVMTTVGPNGPGAPGIHEHTTWPSWSDSSSTTEHPQTSSEPLTIPWWQTSPWWSEQPTEATKPPTTTRRPIVTTTKRTTTRRTTTPSWWSTETPTEAPTQAPIPGPVNVMPVVVEGEKCSIGEYRPNPYNCNEYYRCVYGELHVQHCAGGLHWNHAGTLCDWPSKAQCIEKQSEESNEIIATTTHRPTSTRKTTRRPYPVHITSAPQRPQRPTLRPMLGPMKCMSGQYYPHSDCSKFYICVNGVPVPQDCGPGLQWSQKQMGCNRAEVVRCVANRFLRLISPKAAENDVCEGNTQYPYPGQCEQYLLCNHGQLQAADCADGLHWNQELKICDWPANAKCDADSTSGSSGSASEIDDLNQDYPTKKPATSKPTTTRRPEPTTTQKPLEPDSGYFKVVCYFTNWAWYRKGIAKYTPDDIDTNLCTHVVYGFAILDYSDHILRVYDSWADIDNKFYDRVADLKSKGIKVSLALGGWNDSQGDKYSQLVRNPAARAKFVRQAAQFLEKYNFGGLDLDWEYPVCWQTECKKGHPDEKQGFADLVRELSAEFKPKGLLLSAAVSPSKVIINTGYDVPTLAKHLDWIAVMTYDFHGQWDKKTGHVAPLYYYPGDEFSYFNANYSIHHWIEKGAPSRKIVMGMPLYGQSFTLADTKTHGLNARAPGPGKAGEFTRAAGFLAYYEICDRVLNHGWTVVQDPERRMGPYAYKDNQWVSYDDKEMLRIKSQLIRSLNLGGGMIWALDLDDFNNRCGEGKSPLLHEIRRVLGPAPDANEIDSNEIQQTQTEVPVKPDSGEIEHHTTSGYRPRPTSTSRPVTSTTESSNEVEGQSTGTDEFKVVCYFTNWAWYRQGEGKYLPEDIDPELCTNVIYGFAVLNRETLTITPHDSWADIDNKFYDRVAAYKKKGVKVSVAIGGWNDSAGDKYSRLVRDSSTRARFVKKVIEFIEKWGFEGLDLDWEYPVCWQVDCTKGHADEKEGFASLVEELSAEFKPRGWLLSSAVSPNHKVIDAAYDIKTLSNHFDWIAVMTYDYHGQWDKRTGHLAPMYERPDDVDPTFNCNFTINYWIDQGADRKKLIMGMPMYGQSFSLADNNHHGLNAPTYGGGEAGEDTRARGFLAYYEICQYIRNKGWHVVRDPKGRIGPYAYHRDQWVSFDDQSMIRHKSEFVKAMGLGGAMIWALDLDDFRNICECEKYPLLRTINRVLRNYPGPGPKCQLEAVSEISDEPSSGTELMHPASSTWRPPTTKKPEGAIRPIVPATDTEAGMPCGDEQFSAHKTDCNKYYICQFGSLMELSCPPGLYWNENHCDWPQNSNCQAQLYVEPVTTKKPPRVPLIKPPKKPSKPINPKPVKPTTSPKPIPKPSDDDGYKVVCYFTNWAWYRPGEGKYTPQNIDESLCTHIVYGFAVLNRETLTIKTHDSWADIDNRFYEKVSSLRSKGIRVTIGLGGWNDSLGDKYSKLVLDPEARARFVEQAVAFIEKYNFEGLDLDWEYPVCWQVDCDKGSPEEKDAFAELVKELAQEFRPRGWLLSAAVSPSKMVIDAGYDVPTLAEYLDWISVMTYDYHGQWDKQTGHVAPLYYVPGDTYDYFNANFTIHYWLEKGAPPKKLVMGMPLYGQAFTLSDAKNHGLNARAPGPGKAGRYTRQAGFLAYYEICEQINAGGWTVVRDPEGRIGPYAYDAKQWVSYDDVDDIRRKAKFLKSLKLGGGMVWALDLDDFRGRCGCGKHPLLRTLTQELRGIPGQRANDCT